MNHAANRSVEIFTEALKLSAVERPTYLEQACTGDEWLRSRVEALLKANAQADGFLEPPPREPNVAARLSGFVGEKPGDRIGRYKLLQQIGEGGCGIVFMAEQEEPVRRRVALKILKPGMDTNSVIARFEAERQALALMDHPNIAKVFDAGATESGRPYFVMELVRGVKITDYCDQYSLTTDDRLALFIQVCKAIQHAHQRGIIHRDIKPSNVLVTRTEEGTALPMVIDFGIAKAATNQRLTDKTLFTAFEMLIGTPAYMSPEQAAITNVDVDTRTDIYSLGVLLYELLTGSTPFDSGELLKIGLDEIRRVIREQEPSKPSTRLSEMPGADLTTVAQRRMSEPPRLIRAISGDLDCIAMKALEKDRKRRYETANGLALDVQRYLANEAISARPPSTLYRFQKVLLRNKLLFGAVGTVTVLLLITLAVVTISLTRERQARREADRDKATAQTQATKSHQVTHFLEEMLRGVGPATALGRDTTMLREILDRTAERIGAEMADQPTVEAELRSLIGQLYFDIGNYERAETMHRAALEIHRRVSGTESKGAAASLNDLGQALWKEGKLKEAETTHAEALRIRRHLLGDPHRDVATSLNNLAVVYRHERRLAESETLTREGLQIRQNIFGAEHLEVADSLHNLCIVLGDEGRAAESVAVSREVLAMRRRLLGNDHPLVAGALLDLAWATGFTNKLESKSVQLEALELQRKLLGDQHPDVSISLSSLGERMRQLGEFSEAHMLSSVALSIQRKVLGENSPAYLFSLSTLALTLEQEGKWAEAENAHQEALDLWRKQGVVEENPRALGELEGLARALTAQKKFGEAGKLLADALTPAFIRQPSSLGLLVARTDLLGRKGRWHEAATNAALACEYQPDEHYRYHTLAPLLAITQNRPAYEPLCRIILPMFATTTNPYVAERIAQDCLLLPNSGADLRLVDELADKAVTLGASDPSLPFFQAAKAMSALRLGRFSEAIDWAEKILNTSQAHVYAQAKASAILAMARCYLGQKDQARTMLARGDSLAPAFQPGSDTDEIGGAWVSWLLARISLDEAAALIKHE